MNEYTKIRNTLFAKHNVTVNVATEKAYQLAYDDGHSCGEGEIEHYLRKYLELVKIAYDLGVKDGEDGASQVASGYNIN